MEQKKITYKEKFRPQYHVTHDTGWLNDPNGMVYYEGKWHLFYQLEHRTKYAGHDKWWGHAVSSDLANWEILPIALSPDEYGSIWSGSAVVDENNSSGLFSDTPQKQGLVAFYTSASHEHQRQCMAYSKDSGSSWIKYNGGAPIIDIDADPLKCYDFRDPKVFWHTESEQWMMVIAGGPLRFYSSNDLINWKPEGMQNEIHMECPDFYPLKTNTEQSEQKWILSGCGVWYMTGDFNKIDGVWKFVPDTGERIEFNAGADVYAAQTFSNSYNDRVIKVDWMTHIGYAGERGIQDVTDPWCHVLTLPYELGLIKCGNKYFITQSPVKELSVLREKSYEWQNEIITSDSDNLLKDLSLDKYELQITADVSESNGFGLRLRKSGNEYTEINYKTSVNTLTLDRTKSGTIPFERFSSAFTTKVVPESGKINLHIFVDWSSIEMFAQNGKTVFTNLIFPDAKSFGLEIFANNGKVKIESLKIYELKSIWE